MNRLKRLTGIAIGLATFILAPLAAAALAGNPKVVPVPDQLVARFEGVWAGENNATPFGPMPFAMDFRRIEGGGLHSHSAFSSKTWIDLKLVREDGGWVMHESASLADFGVQTYPMHPVRAAGDTVEWAYLKDPKYLRAHTAVTGDRLYMRVWVRDQEHVTFHLNRLQGETAAQVRAEMEAATELPGDDDMTRFGQYADASDDPIDVRNARAKVEGAPADAAAQLALAGALAEHIQQAPPAKLAVWAGEMLGAYQKAAELDPASVDAHFGLAQYYLNAPPIAGGSAEKAAAQARVLGELDSPLGDVVWAQLEAKRGEREAAAERLRQVLADHPDLDIARKLYLSIAGTEE